MFVIRVREWKWALVIFQGLPRLSGLAGLLGCRGTHAGVIDLCMLWRNNPHKSLRGRYMSGGHHLQGYGVAAGGTEWLLLSAGGTGWLLLSHCIGVGGKGLW